MGNLVRPLQGHLQREHRRDERRALRLSSRAEFSSEWALVLIRDLSEHGLSLETEVDLQVGEIVTVDLPLAGPSDARIVWKKVDTFGGEFLAPIARSAISAALLRAPGSHPEGEMAATVEEITVGMKPTVEQLQDWKTEFERTGEVNGYRLVGFRQTSDGRTIAMVTKTN